MKTNDKRAKDAGHVIPSPAAPLHANLKLARQHGYKKEQGNGLHTNGQHALSLNSNGTWSHWSPGSKGAQHVGGNGPAELHAHLTKVHGAKTGDTVPEDAHVSAHAMHTVLSQHGWRHAKSDQHTLTYNHPSHASRSPGAWANEIYVNKTPTRGSEHKGNVWSHPSATGPTGGRARGMGSASLAKHLTQYHGAKTGDADLGMVPHHQVLKSAGWNMTGRSGNSPHYEHPAHPGHAVVLRMSSEGGRRPSPNYDPNASKRATWHHTDETRSYEGKSGVTHHSLQSHLSKLGGRTKDAASRLPKVHSKHVIGGVKVTVRQSPAGHYYAHDPKGNILGLGHEVRSSSTPEHALKVAEHHIGQMRQHLPGNPVTKDAPSHKWKAEAPDTSGGSYYRHPQRRGEYVHFHPTSQQWVHGGRKQRINQHYASGVGEASMHEHMAKHDGPASAKLA